MNELARSDFCLDNAIYKVQSEDDIVIVRQKVRSLAVEYGFDSFATAAITTATSELCRNLWIYAHGGTVKIDVVYQRENEAGLKIEFEDHGPGIPDIKKVLVGGYSTANSLGLGISGSKKLVDDFEISSEVGRGTKVTVTKWKRLY